MIETWVLSPEYLIAIALDVQRSKDYDRVSRLLGVDRLVEQFELKESWKVFLRRYPEFA